MAKEYVLEGHEEHGTVEKVYESYNGDYWVITDLSRAHPFGYARLAQCPQFAEWGSINRSVFQKPDVWEVGKANWSFTGPEDLNLVPAE
jgi:hypothetical protein